MFRSAVLVATVGLLAFLTGSRSAAQDTGRVHHQIIVPLEDRFTPFAMTIRSGDSVRWTNLDTDDHTVVSDDFFNNAGHKGTNHLLPGTDSNGGVPGTFKLTFNRPGTLSFIADSTPTSTTTISRLLRGRSEAFKIPPQATSAHP